MFRSRLFGGACVCVLFSFATRFVNVGPAASNISESVDSLAYGDLVKNITNEKVSADADLEEQLRFLQVQRQLHNHAQRDYWISQLRTTPAAVHVFCEAPPNSTGRISFSFCFLLILLFICLRSSSVRAYEAKFGALDAQ